MSKKVLSVLLLLTLVLGSVSTAFATEADLVTMDNVVVEDQIVSDDAEAIVEDQIVNDDVEDAIVEDQIVNDEPEAIVEEDTADQEVVQGVNMADIEEAISTGNFAITPRAVGYVMDFAGLKKAVEDPTVNIVVVMADVQMESVLEIDRDITFLAPTGATLFSALAEYPNNRHFNISSKYSHDEVGITLEFSQVILDGSGTSGGIEVEGTSHLKGVTIQNCYNGGGGGAIFVGKPRSFTLEDSILVDNIAIGGGGGIEIYGSGSLVDIIDSEIRNNSAIEVNSYSVGGGIAITGHTVVTVTNSLITGNIARSGGGIGHYGYTNVYIYGSEIVDNIANNGGGICLGNSLENSNRFLHLGAGTKITSNTAHNEGGGVYVHELCSYEHLTATEDVIFSDNKAAEGYFMTDPADIALHNQNILTTNFTEPFTYGYNNFDISYTKGDKLAAVMVNYFIKVSDTTPLAAVAAYAGQTIGAISAPTDPTMDNLVFIGWADEDNVFYGADSVITDDLNLYAVWKLK